MLLFAITPYKPLTYMVYIVATTLLLDQVKIDRGKIINTKTIFKLNAPASFCPAG